MSKRFTLFAFLFMLPLVAMAQTPLYIITGSGAAFTATKNGTTVGTANQTITNVVTAIRTNASGANCEIQFGNGEVLNIGTDTIAFNNTSGTWGSIALSGKITNSGTKAPIVVNGPAVNSKADIVKTSSYAIRNNGTGTLTISGGTISATDYAVRNNSTGTITISGGTISATNSDAYTVHNNSSGTVNISGGTILATGTSANAVRNGSTGTVTIIGGTIINTAVNGDAVLNASTGSVLFGGAATIQGYIKRNTSSSGNFEVIVSGSDVFAPGEKFYTLSNTSYSNGSLAIKNGKNFLGNFEIAGSYILKEDGNDIVVASAGYTVTPGRAIESGEVYVITKAIGGQSIQNIINAIELFGKGADCPIQFGNGERELSITDRIQFGVNSGQKCASVTLLGKIVSSNSSGTIYIPSNYVMESKADIRNSGPEGHTIRHTGSGTFTVSEGTISGLKRAIENDGDNPGTVNITGGTILANDTTVYNKGTVNISDGNIIRESTSGDGIAFYNGGYDGKAYISGNANIFSQGGASLSSDGGTVYVRSYAEIEITGGTITNAANGTAIYNYYEPSFYSGAFTLGGSPIIKGYITKAGTQNVSVVTSGDKIFAPGGKNYFLHFKSYTTGATAVTNGAAFIDNFALSDNTFGLLADGNNLKLSLPVPHSITVTYGAGGTAQASAESAANGAQISLTATPAYGFLFKEWVATAGGITPPNTNPATFTMPNRAVAVRAEFEQIQPHLVTVASNTGGTAKASTISGEEGSQISVPTTEQVTLTAVPSSGYRFKEWIVTGGGITVANTNPAIFTMPNLAVTINAVFELIPIYTVTFNSDGGSSVAAQTVPERGLVAKPADPTKEDFTFLGWVRESLGILWDFATDLVMGNTTLKARWFDPSSFAFAENFENGDNGWVFVNGSLTNKWIIGTATKNSGSRSAYISNNGSANAYTISSTSTVHIYRDFVFPESEDDYVLEYFFKGMGEASYDYMTVRYSATNLTPAVGSLFSSGTRLDSIRGISAWTKRTITLPAANFSGKTMRLVFTWRNDASSGTQPPAAIDDINIYVNGQLPSSNSNSSSSSSSSSSFSSSSSSSEGTLSSSSGTETQSSSSGTETQSSSSGTGTQSSSSGTGTQSSSSGTETQSSSSGTETSNSSSSSEGTQSSSSSSERILNNVSSSSEEQEPSSSSSSDGASPVIISRIASGQTIIQATSNAILLENLPSNAKVQIYNLKGRRIYSNNNHENPLILKIMVQTKGLYFIKINNAVSRVVVR